jgi:hypothetical protein
MKNLKPFAEFEQLLLLDQGIIEKIVSEGEARLEAQILTANAADQRALTFSGFLIGTASATLGAAIALVVSSQPKLPLIAIAFIFAAFMLVATFMAVHSFRPKLFSYPGNLPENWFTNAWNFPESKGRKTKHALVEQCFTLNQAICKNQNDMKENAKRFNLSIDIALYSTILAALILAIYSVILLLPPCSCN